MADTNRGLIPYTDRDYNSLMKDFWDLVPKLTSLWKPDIDALRNSDDPLWKPEADADPGVVLGKFLASAADMLGVNLDYLANEVFAPSVVQRKNAEKIFGLIGYDLGFYTAARTEVTFTNNTSGTMTLDLGFNGSNFTTLSADRDITNTSRIITYNVLPLTSGYGDTDSRSRRNILSNFSNVFEDTDIVTLESGGSCTRVAIEGDLRSYSVAVKDVIKNNYIITLPSQHVDTTAIWIKGKSSLASTTFDKTQWVQVANAAQFDIPEPRFAVTYDNYSNAQITISNYLNQLSNYENYYLTIFWVDCSGVIGSVGVNVLGNLVFAKPGNPDYNSGEIRVTNLSNTVEIPHTYTVAGKSPETAKEAYYNSKNYINTWDSLVTLPDYTRFLKRAAGVDCGTVIDCQKALEINMAIYQDENLSDSQKSKMYITNRDFPVGTTSFSSVYWRNILSEDIIDLASKDTLPFAVNFKTNTAMCYAIHNDFRDDVWGSGIIDSAQMSGDVNYIKYKPPQMFIDKMIADFRPLQSMTSDIQFGYCRIFDFYVIGQVYTNKPVSKDVGDNIIAKIKEALALYFAPAQRDFGQKPTVMEIVTLIQSVDDRIFYFDAGSPSNPVIKWNNCDIDYFNYISFARYNEPSNAKQAIRIAPECLIK